MECRGAAMLHGVAKGSYKLSGHRDRLRGCAYFAQRVKLEWVHIARLPISCMTHARDTSRVRQLAAPWQTIDFYQTARRIALGGRFKVSAPVMPALHATQYSTHVRFAKDGAAWRVTSSQPACTISQWPACKAVSARSIAAVRWTHGRGKLVLAVFSVFFKPQFNQIN